MKKGMSKFITTAALGLVSVAMVGCAAKQPPKGEAAAPPTPTAAAPSGPQNDMYTVVKGDHLWGISSMSKIYGNPYKWPLILKANTDKVKDADLIKPGWVLTITRGDSDAEVARAVKHAKTRGPWSLGPVEASDTRYLAGG